MHAVQLANESKQEQRVNDSRMTSRLTFCTMARATKWSGKVRTVSTYPPKGLFTRDAQAIARGMASRRVSPKGIGSGIRMIQMFINRAGKNLPAHRRRELGKAKRILQAKLTGAR
jgi:tRNA(adenine34) deaminase